MAESTRWHGKVLPQAGNVGEAQIDHLDLVILDRLEKVFRALALVKHLAPPFLEAWPGGAECLLGWAKRGEMRSGCWLCPLACQAKNAPRSYHAGCNAAR